METLQTIWNALTTENEGLLTILSIPLTFIEIYLTITISLVLLNIKSTTKQNYLSVAILSIIGIFTNYFIPSPFNTFINLIAFPIVMIFIYKVSIIKSLISEIIPYILVFVFSYISLTLVSLIFKISTEKAVSIIIYKLLVSLIIYTSLYIFIKLIRKFNLHILSFDDLKQHNNLVLLLNFIIGIITISIQLYAYNVHGNELLYSYFFITTITLIIYFCISIYSLSRTVKLEETSRDLEGEKLVNKSLTILHDNIRAFKHDFNNIVQAIGGYVTTNDMDGLKKYYSQLFDDCQRVNNLTTLSPEIINNPAIYSLLASKYHKADELGIKIDLEVFLDLNTLKVKVYELTRILGILLDNAIEATLECEEKFIKVEIRKDNAHHRNTIIIKNTYLNKDINLDKIFEKSYSTKPNNTGLGLWEVRQILKKNNNLNLFTTKDDKFFIQQLEIYF